MAKKSITKSKPAPKQFVKKYQFAGANYSNYIQQVTNPYYVSGTFAEQSAQEAARSYGQAGNLGNVASNQAMAIEQAKKEEAARLRGVKAETKAANEAEVQQTATDALLTGTNAVKTYFTAQEAAKAAAKAGGDKAADAAKAGSSAGAALATTGVGLGLNVAGTIIGKRGDDNDYTTFTPEEAKKNSIADTMTGAGKGIMLGSQIGSLIPIPGGTLLGGAAGGLIFGAKGWLTSRKENKESKEIADEYKKQQDELAEADRKRMAEINRQGSLLAQRYNTANVNSRLTGMQTGFGYNTSTNMNMQPTSSFYGKTGGKLPGGHMVPIGDDAIKFVGRKHSEGGIKLDPQTEVEGGETMDKVMMNGGKPNDYFFSAYLKLGGKSFAKRHEELIKAGASQKEIQDLAKKQEAVANKKGEKDRGPEQIAKYGGIHKYQTGDFKEGEENARRILDAVDAGAIKPGVYGANEAKAQDAAAKSATTYGDLSGTKPPTNAEQSAKNKGLLDELSNMQGKELDEKMWDGRTKRQHLEEKLNSGDESKIKEANYQMSLLGANDESFKNSTPDQSANAQSNSNASNVTVRDTNQANAAAPSAQTSVAPGGTTNNAGQASKDAAANVGTKDSSATNTSADGTPVTGTPGKERYFGKEDITKGSKGVSKSMEKVPAGQGDQGIYFGNVSNAQFDAFKTNNPWFDFSAGFDPKKRDFTSAKGVKGSSDVARFQQEYNKYVGEGNKLQVDGKLGEQTATAMLMFKDPEVVTPGPASTANTGTTTGNTPAPAANPEEPEEDVVEVGDPRGYTGSVGSVIAGLGQLIPVGYAMARPYTTEGNLPRMQGAGNVGAGSVRGALLPRVNMNAERAAAERNTVAIKNAIQNANAGPGGIAAMMAANASQNEQGLRIANQEQEANKQLAAEEARMGQQASQFNAEAAQRANIANVQNRLAVNQANLEAGIQERKLKIDEKRYKREEILGALDTASSRIAGIVKDEKALRSQERLAKALDNTGAYDRFAIYEELKKESQRKGSPYYGKTDKELKKIASDTYNEFAGDMGDEAKKTGGIRGTRRYTSRLGDLNRGRNKRNFNI